MNMEVIMQLSDVFGPDTVSMRCSAESGEELLRCVSRLASARPAGMPEETIFNALMAREKLSSTACGHGVAIPHCRIEAMEGFTAGLVILREGIDFCSADGGKVDLFPFIIGPEREPRVHLKMLSTLAQAFRDSSLRDSLRNSSTEEEAARVLLNRITPGTGEGQSEKRKLLYVFIQDEEVFDDVLQVFAGMETSSSMVMNADESTRFLRNIPLFASFWNTEVHHFSRIIISVVREELVNAVIRNIEFICGPLSRRDDIMVTVSDIQSFHGSLDS